MTIDIDEVGKIATLAHLTLSSTEQVDHLHHINRALQLIETIRTVDTSNVTHDFFYIDDNFLQHLRADVVSEPDKRDQFLQLAPEHHMGLYIVPTVIENS